MSATTQERFRAAVVAIAPTVLLIGFAYHPYLSDPTDAAVIGAAAASDTTRWGISHIVIGVGYGLIVLAFIAIRSYLREAGEERWSILALPFVVMGSTLFAILPGMEFTPLAAAETGADFEAAQEELAPWFVPVIVTGGICFALGALGFAKGVVVSGTLRPKPAWLVAGALVVMTAARFVPLGPAQYVIGAAGVVALWPVAYVMWRHPETRPADQPRFVPTT